MAVYLYFKQRDPYLMSEQDIVVYDAHVATQGVTYFLVQVVNGVVVSNREASASMYKDRAITGTANFLSEKQTTVAKTLSTTPANTLSDAACPSWHHSNEFCAIWRGFAKRGFGSNATGTAEPWVFVPSWSVPAECPPLTEAEKIGAANWTQPTTTITFPPAETKLQAAAVRDRPKSAARPTATTSTRRPVPTGPSLPTRDQDTTMSAPPFPLNFSLTTYSKCLHRGCASPLASWKHNVAVGSCIPIVVQVDTTTSRALGRTTQSATVKWILRTPGNARLTPLEKCSQTFPHPPPAGDGTLLNRSTSTRSVLTCGAGRKDTLGDCQHSCAKLTTPMSVT
ncbi:hypothetical protein M427DRAFT_72284 [Gonapodya prolifera JEL478]|uniref:Fungalysin n=1 Tax=Gonapodya prolifera (strain JEL478) TaxID=1344416 RepID=A0A139A598_GONPJ|nr:hypothetical protein M427DRAFT_72284 [Gonapodya prolifera JEL478]|eukprot:KXS11987.1 hypothetical protein M427DRAFT_72284 [Gonapodya prolifera JEL478]